MEVEFNTPVRPSPIKLGIRPARQTASFDSKYTVHHIAHFHEVTIALVLAQKVNPVGLKDQENLVAFSRLMVRLMQGTQITYGVVGKVFRRGDYFTAHPPGGDKGIELSATFKRRLLNWMADLVLQTNLSMEEVLDSYFNAFPFAINQKLGPANNTFRFGQKSGISSCKIPSYKLTTSNNRIINF